MIDLIIRRVDGYGWLPIVEIDGEEVFRGSFKDTPEDALAACVERLGS